MVERRDTHFTSNGTSCVAWHYLPDVSGPRPYVVMGHGLGATMELGLDDFAQRFAEAGYGVFAFDYRGFGASDGEPRQVISVRRQLEDWRAALDFVRSLPAVEEGRIAIWGSSFGGGHVISVAARDVGIAAVVSQVPFTDGLQSLFKLRPLTAVRLTLAGAVDAVRSIFGATPKYVPLIGRPGEVALMSAPDSYDGYMQLVAPEAAESGRWRNRAAARIALTIGMYSPRRAARKVKAPLLVVAAHGDSIAPAKGAVAAAKRAPHGELIEYDGGHFDYYKGPGFDQIVTDELAFLDRHLRD
jgi:pimeloyl-ACP methyl ester carboxylesterase